MRRILSIDGGGIRGVFPAAFLARLEDALPAPIAEYFDLIVGTSTGGIIAIGLGLGLSAREILRLYLENARRIFPRPLGMGFSGIFGAKYARTALREVLTEAFGDRRLGDSRQRLLIPSLNLATEHVHLYKTSHHLGLFNDYKALAVEAALATVAAPTYFPIHLSPEGIPFIDGSVWAHNPAGLAIIEAVGILGWPRDEIRLLSLGCISSPMDISWRKRTSLGKAYWGARLARVFMTAQSSSAIVTANALIGPESVFRVNPDIGEHRFTVDGLHQLPLLSRLGFDEAESRLAMLESAFFSQRAEEFVPCHTLSMSGPPLSPVAAVAH